MEFQDIEYEFLQGVYWDEGFNDRIKSSIHEIYDMRLEYKKDNNPLEQVCKLVLNGGSYGKSIVKVARYRTRFFYDEDSFYKYFDKNANMIRNFYTVPGTNYYSVEELNCVFEHRNRAHCGAIILSQSKRIMNRVLYVCSQIPTEPKYTDTDSLILLAGRLQKLVRRYNKRYNRDMIGDGLGQFHDELGPVSRGVVIDKKIYCLEYGNKYKIACKGIPEDVLLHNASKEGYRNPLEMFMSNRRIVFDLLATGKVRFSFDLRSYHVSSTERFTRTIDFRPRL